MHCAFNGFYCDVITSVKDSVDSMVKRLAQNDISKYGGYFTLLDGKSGNNEILIMCKIGTCSPEKAPKYFILSQEKANRLAKNPDHQSSWHSRVPDADKYGGAIRTDKGYIMSFSGLPELADEAVMLHAAQQMDWISMPTILAITEMSENTYF